jgi:2-oxoisovalerate dehydrogenase E1 component alpha subunit
LAGGERIMNHSSGPFPAIPEISVIDPASSGKLQAYQTITPDGASLLSDRDPPTILKRLVDIYNFMVRLRCLDETFKQAQRQGKLPFYLESTGEEAAVVASAAALEDDDHIFTQYREHGALLWRGTSMEAMAHQCCGTRKDSAKGRQMPVHYGDKEKNFHTISSPLATQLLHSVGFAYAQKLKGESCISVCYFGEGAASEGDFHAAMNFASTLGCPVLFICRNNGWAISTPSNEQYRGDGISSRASGYGIGACRVDGGDARAVYNATAMARSRVLESSSPFLLELMVYRLGDHSTSDDSKNYVPDEIRLEGIEVGDPIARLHAYLGGVDSRLVNDTRLERIRNEAIQEARRAISVAEQEPIASVCTMFDDVYDEMPQNLQEQKAHIMQREKQHVPHVT